MKPTLSRSRFAFALAGLSALVGMYSCQSSVTPEPSGPIAASASAVFDTAWMKPDSLTWAVGSAAAQKVSSSTITDNSVTAKFTLNAPTKEVVTLGWWVGGMRFMKSPYTQKGSESNLTKFDISERDPVAMALLSELTLPKQRNRDTINATYARHLLNGDAAYKGFPANCPTGLDTAVLIKLALTIAVSKQVPLDTLAKTWILNIDLGTLHIRIQQLVGEGKIPAKDTAIAFPRYPVRTTTPISLTNILPGKTVAVRGVFEGDSGLSRIGWRIVQGNADRSTSFRFSYSAQLDGTQKLWDLDKNAGATLTEVSASLGVYTLMIWAVDSKNRADTSSASFRVIPMADTSSPTIEWISPNTSAKYLENKDSIFLVRLKVSDSSGLASVTINGIDAEVKNGEQIQTMTVPVIDTGFTVVVVAMDNAGNVRRDFVRLIRKPASKQNDPRIELKDPVSGSTVPFETKSVKFSWKVVDPVGPVDSVLIQGKTALKSDSIYSANVELPITGRPTTVVLTVYTRGSKSVTFADQAVVTRAADLNGPTLRWIAPVGAENLAFADSIYTIKVVANDLSGVASVSVMDSAAKLTDSVWSKAIVVPVGGTGSWIRVKAFDKDGNVTIDSVQLFRMAKPLAGAPVVALQAPKLKTGNVLPYDSAFVTASWRIVDLLSGVDESSVKIGGVAAKLVGDSTWSARVPVPATGTVTFVTLEVKSKTGIAASDFFSITRTKDAILPVVKSIVGSRTVAFDSLMASVSWSATDNDKLDKVWIQNIEVADATGVYKASVALKVGRNPAVIRVKDVAGNEATDTAWVVRSADTTKPVVKTASKAISVPFDSTKATMSWTVVDNDKIGSVKIAGVAVTGNGNVYSTRADLKLGANSFDISVLDASGNPATDTVVVTRLPDNTKPTVVLVSGSGAVSFDSLYTTLVWNVTDNDKVSAVVINGVVVTSTGSLYSARVPLVEGVNRIPMSALDPTGNPTYDTAVVSRGGDQIKPVIVAKPGAKSVEFDTTGIQLSWTVTDNAGIGSVKIAGIVATKSGDVYTARVSGLALGDNRIAMVATDLSGNPVLDTATVTRKPDAVKPVAKVVAFNTPVAFEIDTATLVWNVSDNDAIQSMTVTTSAGVTSLAVAAQAKIRMNLAVGSNSAVLVVTDRTGNSYKDSQVVVRGPDATKPVITKVTGSQTVKYESTSMVVSWNVVDNGPLGAVTIQGKPATVSGSVYSLTVNLAVGANSVVIKALDKANNESTDEVVITRSDDATAPVVTHAAGTSNRTVPFETTTASLGWLFTDNVGVSSVKLNGVLVAAPAGTYATDANLNVGTNVFALWVADNAGNTTKDTVTIQRSADATKPVVTLQSSVVTNVPFETKISTVGWTVTDNDVLASVKINGSAVSGSMGNYAVTVSLSVGANVVNIVATDRTGNSTAASVIITRGADATLPVITPTSVPASPAEYKQSYTVIYNVTDNDAVSSMTVNGVAATKSGNNYSASITLSNPGVNQITAIAKDPTGNTSTNVMNLDAQLKDAQGNSYPIGKMPDNKIWMKSPLLDKDSLNGAAQSGYALRDGQPATFFSWARTMALPDSCGAPANVSIAACALDTTVNRRGICPVGWHVPRAGEWMGLVHAAAQGASDDSIGVMHLKANEVEWSPGPGDDLFGMHLQADGQWSGGGSGGVLGLWWAASPASAASLSYGGVFRVQTNGFENNQGYMSHSLKRSSYIQVRCLAD